MTVSSSRPLSMMRVAVMIFVVEAMGRRSWAFFSHSTVPVTASTRIAEAALHSGTAMGASVEGGTAESSCARTGPEPSDRAAKPRAMHAARRNRGTGREEWKGAPEGRRLDRQVRLFGDRCAKAVLQLR